VLLLAFFWYGARAAMRGPEAAIEPQPNAVRPGLAQAGPALVGRGSTRPIFATGE
jgi:cytochrome bd ubiquinol oxidase subunit I